MLIDFIAQPKDLMGTPIRRVLPVAKKRMMGHFIFLDHMGPVQFPIGKDTSVGAHPHIGLATLTYLFEGQIHHRDSLGTSQIITPGDVNWMIAGQGISHSERGVKGDELKVHRLHGLQFWMALPDADEDCAPQFFNFKKETIPQKSENGFLISEIVGPHSPVPATQESTLLILKSNQPNAHWNSNLTNQELAIYIVKGTAVVNKKVFSSYQAGLFSAGSSIEIKAFENCELIIFGGRPYAGQFGQTEKSIFWNFVSSSKEKIRSAVTRWNSGDFPMVPGESDRILSPEFKR